MSRRARLLRVVVIGFALVYFAACGFLWSAQRHLIFFPSAVVDLTPQNFGAKFEPVAVRGGSGEILRGWWIPAATNDCALVYLHGNGGNVSANAAHGVRLSRLGCSVLLLDYRGYGRSDGKFPSEASVYADAETAWSYVVGDRGFKPAQTVIYGHSLGGAVAIELARQHPDAKRLIVESSFTSVRDMTNLTPAYRAFPIPWLLSQRFDSIHKIPKIHMPVLLIHGTADRIVPSFMGERLFRAANQPKNMTLIAGGHHEDCATIGGQEYVKAVTDFLQPKGEKAVSASK